MTATVQSVLAACQAALDEACDLAGVPSTTSLINTLTAQNATLTARNAVLDAAIAGVRARAQARKDADAANVDGQDDLDALAGV
jgi:hypothetical protein